MPSRIGGALGAPILAAPSDAAAGMIDGDTGDGTKNGKRGDLAKT
jgi:hypothetical protein